MSRAVVLPFIAVLFVAIGTFGLLATHGQAAPFQTPKPQVKLAPPSLTCADFHRNEDGSWSPTHTVLFGSTALSPGSRVQRGVRVFGADLAATLTARCFTGS